MIIDTSLDKDLIKFLFNNNHINEIIDHIVKYFGDSKIIIEYIRDPEGNDDGILMSILYDYKSENNMHVAINNLSRFEEEWWLDQMGEEYRIFSIDIMPA